MANRFTTEEIEYLREIANGRYVVEIAQMFNQKFGVHRSERSIHSVLYRNKIKTNTQGSPKMRDENGRLCNTIPVGSEQIRRNNTVYIKVDTPSVRKPKHMYLYEQRHGVIPDGYRVIFADGNKRNFDDDNLILVEQKVFVGAQKRALLFDNAELTRSGLLLAELLQTINEKDEKVTNKEE